MNLTQEQLNSIVSDIPGFLGPSESYELYKISATFGYGSIK